MRRTIISAIIGAGLAMLVTSAIDTYLNIRTAARFAELQQAAPSDWLDLSPIEVRGAISPDEPSLRFVGTPAMDLLIRLAISPQDADTGAVVCSGGGRATLYEGGISVPVDSRLSSLAGLESCQFPPGRYKVRLSFFMVEPDTQVSKTLMVETQDVEVIAGEALHR